MDWLNSAAFTLWGSPVTWAEVFGDITGGLCVWLLARQHILNWPLGLVNNVLWCLLFFHAKLYGDAFLQTIFFALGAYGWWMWVFGGPGAHDSLRVRRTTSREWTALAVLTALGTWGFAVFLRRYTDSPVPLRDASVLTLSLAATYGQTQKALESWWIWIVVDVISVPLYINRHLYPTAGLYVVFGVLCVGGLREWTRDLRETRSLP